LLSCAALVAADLAGRTLLQNGLYITYLIPAMALAAGALLQDPLSRLRSGHYVLLVVVTTVAFIAPFVPALGARFSTGSAVLLAASGLAVSAAAVWVRSTSRLTPLIALILSAGALNVVAAEPLWEFYDVPRRARMYLATVEAAEALRMLDRDTAARYWFDETAPLGLVYHSIAATRLSGYRLLGSRFPSLWNTLSRQDAAVEPGQDLVLIAADRTAFADAVAALGARGLGAALAASHDITAGDIRLVLLLLRTEIDPRLLEDAPLGVSATTFLEGSTMGA